jgi:protein required for attachment to host cells
MKPVRTWVLVADGSRARVLENLGPGKGLHQVPATDEAWQLPANRDILADRPGRSHESHGNARHAIEPRSDPHRDLKRAFAVHLIGELEQRHAAHHFDRLVLVAPPEMLGNLRAGMPKKLAAIVSGELNQDLTHVATNEIGSHLAKVLAS